MTGVQAQAAKLLEGFSKLTFKACLQGGNYLDIGQLEVIMMALGKQVPKLPDIEGDGYDPEGNMVYDTWICPNCEKHYEMDYDDYKYCPNCGQAIDWRKK